MNKFKNHKISLQNKIQYKKHIIVLEIYFQDVAFTHLKINSAIYFRTNFQVKNCSFQIINVRPRNQHQTGIFKKGISAWK